jgi:hypothetical protein
MFTVTLLKNRLVQLGLVGLLAFGGGAIFHHMIEAPKTTTSVVHDVTQVRVEVPVLTTKIVDKIITDPVQQEAINKLIKENNALKLKLVQVSSSIAQAHTSGGTDPTTLNPGTITSTNPNDPAARPVTPDPVVRPTPTDQTNVVSDDPTSTFKDYQLTANYSRTKFSYDLTQTFIIESSSGKDSQGTSSNLVRLFQETPKGLVTIPTKTVVIDAVPNPTKWFVSPRIQGGLSVDQDQVKSGFVGLQLLKRGTSKDPKDLKISVATVGVALSSGSVRPTIIPINFNVGSPKLSPFSNLWIGPTIDFNKKVGIAITATF